MRPSKTLFPRLQKRSFCSQKQEGIASSRFGQGSRTVSGPHWVRSGADTHLQTTETSASVIFKICSSPWRQTTPSEGVPGAPGAVAKSTSLPLRSPGRSVSRRRQNTGESQKGQGLCSSLLIQSGSAGGRQVG